MEHKIKGFCWDKESTKKASSKDIMEKLEEAKDPEITVKFSDLIDLSKLRQKLEEGNKEVTFYDLLCQECFKKLFKTLLTNDNL